MIVPIISCIDASPEQIKELRAEIQKYLENPSNIPIVSQSIEFTSFEVDVEEPPSESNIVHVVHENMDEFAMELPFVSPMFWDVDDSKHNRGKRRVMLPLCEKAPEFNKDQIIHRVLESYRTLGFDGLAPEPFCRIVFAHVKNPEGEFYACAAWTYKVTVDDLRLLVPAKNLCQEYPGPA